MSAITAELTKTRLCVSPKENRFFSRADRANFGKTAVSERANSAGAKCLKIFTYPCCVLII